MAHHDNSMNTAFDEAFHAMRNNLGGPFGAVILKDGQVIGRGHNMVSSLNDPTAHAEIVAIRDACKRTGSFDLSGAEIYSTCEPCPMCFSAIYWANVSAVYYVLTRHEAEAIGFRDSHIYDQLGVPFAERSIPFRQVDHPRAAELFREWMDKTDKTVY